MTAKSSAKKPAASSKQPAKSAAATPATPGSRNRRETVSDDDPFELERKQQTSKVIPLLRKPVKGKMNRYVCPMCDTPGFASSKVVGKEVKCSNPDCLAPVFLIPDTEAAERKTTEEKKPVSNQKSKIPLILAIVIPSVAIVGAYFYFTTSGPDGSELAKPFDNPIIKNQSKNSMLPRNDTPTVNPLANNAQQPQTTTKQEEKPVDPEAVQKESLNSMVELSRSRENRSKPFSRRLTAEAYAIYGDLAGSREQIGRIDTVDPVLPFYKIFPLIEIGWIQLKEKDSAGLKKTLDETVALSKQIPEYGGRDTLDLISRLAAFWVAAGNEEAAEDLISKHQAENSLAQLSAYLQIAHETNYYDFETLIDLHRRWNAPQSVATTLILVSHGYPEAALNWAALAPDAIDRTEAVTQWSLAVLEQAVNQDKKPGIELIQPAEMKLSATGNALMYARCAHELNVLKKPELAKAFLAKSKSFLDQVPVPTPMKLGSLKEIYTMKLPASEPLELTSQAYLQIALAEAELGEEAEANRFLKNAVQAIQATAPSLTAVQSKQNESSNFNFKDQIKNTLNLDSNDRINRAIRDYRKQLNSMKSAAENRTNLLVSLLSQAAKGELSASVWNLAQQSQQATDENLKDPLLDSSLPATILDANQKNSDLTAQIKKALNDNIPPLKKEDLLVQQTLSLIRNGKPEQAAHQINQDEDLKKAWKGQLSLKLLSVLINQSKFEQAIQFVTAIKDQVLREDMLNTIGAIAAIQNKVPEVSAILESNVYTPTERISGYLGLITGLQIAKASSAKPVPTQPAADKL
ncbi:MAG: hypothetical protein KDA70_00555 [Planctomycetaceae bacterium]|nr:hypothetical protein [Planctomycetaceae bacterium]